MFKKISHAYEVLIGKTKNSFFEDDLFADFFASFLRKYKSMPLRAEITKFSRMDRGLELS